MPAETGPLFAVPLAIEAWAVRCGMRGRPGAVVRTGMGAAHSSAALPSLRAAPAGALVVAGFAGALHPALHPGDVVVADEVHGETGVVHPFRATMLAAALRSAGLRVYCGQIRFVDKIVHRRGRSALARTGALAVDMESAVLAQAAVQRPFAVIRAIVDTPERPLIGPHTIGGAVYAIRALTRIGPAVEKWAEQAGS